ncbi:MAG TPA: hypothetical protein PKD53_15235 [Chloroflexaceae bacterium]|nr:hypothetical protein [Chloroflexaceae bacterium]
MPEGCCVPVACAVPAVGAGDCPGCHYRGRQVALLTVQAQVAISLRVLGPSPYHFCATPGCEVVYYAAGSPPILRRQMREQVFQKEHTPDVLVCYCFRYSLDMLQRSDEVGRAAILADIIAGTRQGQCACELRNPQGSCCLGNVRRLLRDDEPIADKKTEGLA